MNYDASYDNAQLIGYCQICGAPTKFNSEGLSSTYECSITVNMKLHRNVWASNSESDQKIFSKYNNHHHICLACAADLIHIIDILKERRNSDAKTV